MRPSFIVSPPGNGTLESTMGRSLAGLVAISLLTAAAPERFIVTYDGGGNLNAYRQTSIFSATGALR